MAFTKKAFSNSNAPSGEPATIASPASSPRRPGTVLEDGRRIKNLSRVTACAVAIAIIGCGFGIYSAFDAASKVSTANAGREPSLVVAQAVERGEVIEAADLKVMDIPESLRVEGAVLEDQADQVIGRTAATKLAVGSQLTDASIAGEGNTTSLADAIAPGSEAVTVSVDAATGISSLLRIGDAVRVVSTATDADGAQTTTDLAPEARVVGLDGAISGNGGDYTAVTVEVTNGQATSIRQAQDGDAVSLVLLSSAR